MESAVSSADGLTTSDAIVDDTQQPMLSENIASRDALAESGIQGTGHGLPPAKARELAEAIAAELGEEQFQPKRSLFVLSKQYGETFVREHLARAREIETAGGLLVKTGDRRRTFGGVFFLLARETIGEETWARLFPFPPKRRRQPTSKSTAVDATTTASAITKPARTAQPGEARSVKITITGRPGPIEDRGTCIETTMENRKLPDVPKGLPELPKEPTNWRVFLAKKTWARVEAALSADPDDMLIVDGWPTFDKAAGVMTAYATNATTTALLRGAKATAKPPPQNASAPVANATNAPKK